MKEFSMVYGLPSGLSVACALASFMQRAMLDMLLPAPMTRREI